jgi:Fur family ferric uptake transcriptional regulator
MTSIDKATRLIKSAGLKTTQARVAILDLLMRSLHGLNHQEIEKRLLEQGYRFDRVTVYRTLHHLAEAQIIHKLVGLDRSFVFAYLDEGRVPDRPHPQTEHPHFICESCATTYCLDKSSYTQGKVEVPVGFTLKHAELHLFGICPQCH